MNDGGLHPSVHSLLDRLDDRGVRLVEELFTGLPMDVPVLVERADIEQTVQPYSWLLQRVGADRLALTGAGLLPPAVVAEAVAALDLEGRWPGKGNRESHTQPVRWLRESAQRMGLVRRLKGRLVLAPKGKPLMDDPPGLWRHLAKSLPATKHDVERDAGLLLLLAAASGQELTFRRMDTVLLEGMRSLGWRRADGTPLRHFESFQLGRGTYDTLRLVGAVADSYVRPSTPTHAGVGFARAAIRS